MNPVLRDLGRDDRGWRTVLVPARQPGADRSIFVLTVSGTDIQLAQQEEGDMTVFFNPDPNGRMVLVPASKLGVDRNLITLTVSGKDFQLVRPEKL